VVVVVRLAVVAGAAPDERLVNDLAAGAAVIRGTPIAGNCAVASLIAGMSTTAAGITNCARIEPASITT
jgi:hypothetical protein